MAWTDIAFLILGVAFIAILLRAASIIRRNPDERLRGLEDMGVRFPPTMPYERRHQLLDWFGIAPRHVWRPLAVLAAVLVFAIGIIFCRVHGAC
ncbi:MAG: hypothetical protein KJZ96_16000 [Rhodocyclaceae bacterium]|nr:hypothetical protein [Rhodocyclaceae bacterium]